MAQKPTPDHSPAGDDQRHLAEKHNRVLLHALQVAHPVLYRERERFIHTLTFQQLGGRIDTTVYLAGDATPLAASDVTLAPIIQNTATAPAAPESTQ
jgi:hypothetical protein